MDAGYKEFKSLNMPAIEAGVAAAWARDNTFEQSVEARAGAQPFVFYEGPPSANGMPGIHHVISRTLKDLVCRYKTMQGFQVRRKAGWDTHGLPVELGVEKELGITKEDIGVKISVEDYNERCREAVMRYKKEWDSLTQKMGYWVDLTDPYITFDNKYIESVWWCLKQLFDKNLLYKSVSIQPYSPAAGTGLSSHELNQPGTYKNVKDTTVVAMFKAIDSGLHPAIAGSDSGLTGDVFFLAWTTTPWTLPSNLGLTVGGNIDYALVDTFNPYTHQPCKVILAEALIDKYFKTEGQDGNFVAFNAETKLIPWKILTRMKGTTLEGIRYEQLLAFAGNTPATSGGDPFRVVVGDFVTTEDGTGIVHTAPAFGADDFRMGKKANLGILTLVDKEGKFVDGVGEFSGRFIKNYKDDDEWKDVDLDIALKLKIEGKAFKIEKYEHNYPHCWRTDKPVIYYPLDAWFIRTTAVKDRMIELNKTINWKPASTGTGRFGNWLENMVDWNLSRSRYWGTPLPVWVSDDGSEKKCIGSVRELLGEMKKADKVLGFNQVADITGSENPSEDDLKALLQGTPPANTERDEIMLETARRKFDLHKPFVDSLVLVDSKGTAMRREPDLIDVWFDSGAMPYAQWHYPFENKALVDAGKAFPADFIAEGVDQTRGWFYTLHALGVLLFDSVAYKTVVSNGLVLDKNGAKMSKRIGNVVDPFATIEKYSADATRWYLITNASPWDNLKFDIEGIAEVQRKLFGTLFNTYGFFALYANVDGFKYAEMDIPLAHRPELDRWILSSLHTLIGRVEEHMDDYEPTMAGRAIEDFVDSLLSNWYVRQSRRRFWKGEYEHDKISAYQTLYECLQTLARLIAPVSPFFADWLWTNLNEVTRKKGVNSVHIAGFPVKDNSRVDVGLEERIALAREMSSLILSLRKKVMIKVRQPLQKAIVPYTDPALRAALESVEEIIKAEVNVKGFEYINDSEGFIKKRIKPNFKLLGARLGGRMKAAAAAIAGLGDEQILRLQAAGEVEMVIDGDPLTISSSEVDIIAEDVPGFAVATAGNLTVALDITVTPELQMEGDARDLVKELQLLRKEAGMQVTDRIRLEVMHEERIKEVVERYNTYICAEILADDIQFVENIITPQAVSIRDIALKMNLIKI